MSADTARLARIAAGAAVLLAAGGCGESGPDLELREDQPTAAVATRFAWPAEVECEVEEGVVRGGLAMTLRYRARLEPAPEGYGFVLHRYDVEIAAIDDVPVDTTAPEVREMLAVLRIGMPPVHIDANGRCTGIHDPEGFAREASAFVAQDPGLADGPMLRQAIEISTHPSMRSLADAAAAEPWIAWVEAWTGCSLAPGGQEEIETRAYCALGPVTVKATRTLEGFVRNPADHAKYDVTSEFDSKSAIGTAGSAVLGLLGGNDVKNASFRVRRRAVVDPTTLVPLRVESVTWVSSSGDAAPRIAERHRYAFRWRSEAVR